MPNQCNYIIVALMLSNVERVFIMLNTMTMKLTGEMEKVYLELRQLFQMSEQMYKTDKDV